MRRLYSRLPKNMSILSQTILDDPSHISLIPHVQIERWRVKEGDEVRQGDLLAEVSSGKIWLDVRAKIDGRVTRTIGKEGDDIHTGHRIVVIRQISNE